MTDTRKTKRRMFVALKFLDEAEVDVNGFPLHFKRPLIGILPVYESRELAEEACPGAPVEEIRFVEDQGDD